MLIGNTQSWKLRLQHVIHCSDIKLLTKKLVLPDLMRHLILQKRNTLFFHVCHITDIAKYNYFVSIFIQKLYFYIDIIAK